MNFPFCCYTSLVPNNCTLSTNSDSKSTHKDALVALQLNVYVSHRINKKIKKIKKHNITLASLLNIIIGLLDVNWLIINTKSQWIQIDKYWDSLNNSLNKSICSSTGMHTQSQANSEWEKMIQKLAPNQTILI